MPLRLDTATRRMEPEWMDDPALSEEHHREALRGLARINAVSRSSASIWSALRRSLDRAPGPSRVLDVACGGGDVALALQQMARRAGVALIVDGCDISATAVSLAEAQARQSGSGSRFFRHDALSGALPPGYDAVVSSLFLHHLVDTDAVGLLRRMAAAADTIVVNDLRRGALGYALAFLGTRLLTRSPVVHVDGPRSVRGAFTVAEARHLAARAGLSGATVQPVFPWRWRLGWSRA